MGGGEGGKRAKTTPDAGEKSVSEKSQVTLTCRNPFEKSKSKEILSHYHTRLSVSSGLSTFLHKTAFEFILI